MVGAISSIGAAYSANAIYGVNSYYGVQRYHRGADPETPVQPVRSAPPVTSDEATPVILPVSSRDEGYAAEQAVRMRMQYSDPSIQPSSDKALNTPVSQLSTDSELPAAFLYNPAEMAVRMRIQYADPAAETDNKAGSAGIEDVQKANEDGRCETCEKRKYQDGSDDPSVSFQTPTRIDPDSAASTVRGHEMEHVFHEQSKAEREDRKVVSQSVTLHTDICPECGKVYVSGGTTRTVTKADNEPESSFSGASENSEK